MFTWYAFIICKFVLYLLTTKTVYAINSCFFKLVGVMKVQTICKFRICFSKENRKSHTCCIWFHDKMSFLKTYMCLYSGQLHVKRNTQYVIVEMFYLLFQCTHIQHKHRLFSTTRTAVNRPGHSCINAVRQARVRFPRGTPPLVTRQILQY